MISHLLSWRKVWIGFLFLVLGVYYCVGSRRDIKSYIPDQPLWVYQTAQIQFPPFHPVFQEPFQQAKKWLTQSPSTYWFAAGYKVGAQTESYLLYVHLEDTERQFVTKVRGKVGRRTYRDWQILTLISEKLYATRLQEGWLISPSEFLVEKALDGGKTVFTDMPLHPEIDRTSFFIPANSSISHLSSPPWNKKNLYIQREKGQYADIQAPEFISSDWVGQNPIRVKGWEDVPDQLIRLDLWNISSRKEWASTHPDWPSAWHFILPEKGGACWQFQTKGESPILYLPVEDEEAIPFLSGGQSGSGGIYPLALNFLGQKLLGEKIPNPSYFLPLEGGIAFSETASALQWYQNQRLTGISAAESQLFTQHIIPTLLPRQSRLTLIFPNRGPSFLAWEGMHGLNDQAAARFSYGKPLPPARPTRWIRQSIQQNPTSSIAWLSQDPKGNWYVGTKPLFIQTEVQTSGLATWQPMDGLWLGSTKNQTVWHAKTRRTFDVTSDSPMVGLFQNTQDQSCILTKFGQVIPLNPKDGLVLSKSTQLERLDRNSQFQVVQSSQGDPLLLRRDAGTLTLFTANGGKLGTIQTKNPSWKQIRYEVLPNKLTLVILFDGQSHYLYTQDGNWLGQKEIPGSGPLEIQYAASYRKLMVYSQLNGQWQLWALGPIDN